MFYDLVVMDHVHILHRTKCVRQQRGMEFQVIYKDNDMQNKIISDTAKLSVFCADLVPQKSAIWERGCVHGHFSIDFFYEEWY